jgi:hypothetical protein
MKVKVALITTELIDVVIFECHIQRILLIGLCYYDLPHLTFLVDKETIQS